MKLVASMMVGPGEYGRYLRASLAHVASYCDEVRVRWEGDIHGVDVAGGAKVHILRADPTFYRHEGRARQELLDWTLKAAPTHVLAIDADEFVADPVALRAAIESEEFSSRPPVGAWSLCMQEVWEADEAGLGLRMDGGWGEHDAPILWAPGSVRGALVMPNKALASGRTPTAVSGAVTAHSCSAILHFGWANRAERAARYQRYVTHDGGRYHNRAHLDSIMYPDDLVTLLRRDWPPALEPHRAAILAHAT